MSIIQGNIEIYMGPQQLGAPDNLEAVIIKFIDGTKKTLDVAVQELDSKAITEALIRARQRRVVVKVVLEGSYLSLRRARKDPFKLSGQNEMNRQLHDAILRAKINVHTDFNPAIFHQKFMIRDRRKKNASVLTGSTNFTDLGVEKNLNHVVIVRNKEIARIYSKEFKEIMQGHFGKINEGHDKLPRAVTVSGVRVKILFAPDHNPEMEVMKQLLKARSSIDFAIFTFAQSSGIDDAIINVAKLKTVKIRGALDGPPSKQKWGAAKPIAKEGVELYSIPHRHGVGKLHHKLMVIDGQLIIAGSFNYTGPATRLNDENIIIIGDLEETNTEAKKTQKLLGSFAAKEIDRIITAYGEKF